MSSSAKQWLLLCYLVLAWGLAFALIAVALRGFHPTFVVWWRLTLGALVMWGVWYWQGADWPFDRAWWPRLILLSLTGNIIPFSLIAWAEQTVPSAEVGILMALMPIATLLLAHWLLEHESLTLTKVGGVSVGFLGVGLLFGEALFSAGSQGQLSGKLATLGAALSYAFNGVYARRLPVVPPVALAFTTLTIGSVLLALPLLLLPSLYVVKIPDTGAALAVMALGILATGVATWVYFVIVQERGPTFLSTINYLIPAVAFAAGVVFLSEPWGWWQVGALILILCGVWLVQHSPTISPDRTAVAETARHHRRRDGQ